MYGGLETSLSINITRRSCNYMKKITLWRLNKCAYITNINREREREGERGGRERVTIMNKNFWLVIHDFSYLVINCNFESLYKSDHVNFRHWLLTERGIILLTIRYYTIQFNKHFL